jgi:hypothetical protein
MSGQYPASPPIYNVPPPVYESLQQLGSPDTEISFDAFLPYVTPYVHDVATFVATAAVRDACIEFCEQTLFLLYAPEPITCAAYQGEADIELPNGYQMTKIVSAYFNGLPMVPASFEDLLRMYPQDYRLLTGMPNFVCQATPSKVMLVPTPDTTSINALNLIVACQPNQLSCSIDAKLYYRYAEVIAFGARARLLDTPNQPYYDPVGASRFRGWFKSGYGKATIERNRGMTRDVVRVRAPRLV